MNTEGCTDTKENVEEPLASVLAKLDRLLTLNYRNQKFDFTKIYLCTSQLQKMLYAVEGLSEQPLGTVERIFKYLSFRKNHCLKEIEFLLDNHTLLFNKDERLGRFIDKLDAVLRVLSNLTQLEMKDCENAMSTNTDDVIWKTLLDDLLLQAVTVSKVSGGIDSKEINASCQKVLKDCKQFEMTVSADVSNWKLNCEILGDALMQLERRVSSALLRLLLKVFSDVHLPLKRLVSSVNEKSTSKNKNVEDLDKVVEEFDYHSDCIQHLCIFALAFCDDKNCLVPINCCLASLESLDSYLVPAVLDVYMDQQSEDKLYYLKFLVDHWYSEVKNLESLLDRVIDPTAFTTVTLQSIQCDVERAKSIADYITESAEECTEVDFSAYVGILNNIITESQRLSRHLKQCNDVGLTAFKKRLKLVTNECIHIVKLPLNGNDCKSVIKRTLKRFDLLVSAINEVLHCLSTDTVNFNDGTAENDQFQHTTSLLNRIDITNPSSNMDLTQVPEEMNQSRKIGRGDFVQNVYFANLHKRKMATDEREDQDNNSEMGNMSNLMGKHTLIKTFYEPSPRKKANAFSRTPCKLMASLHLSEDMSKNSSCGLEITSILENLDAGKNQFDTVSTVEASFLIEQESELSINWSNGIKGAIKAIEEKICFLQE